MEFTITFAYIFYLGIYLAAPLLLSLIVLIVLLGQVAGKMEGWSRFDAVYWSFITALTVGYGDIRPLGKTSKILAVLITLAGFIFTGIFVAIAVHAATRVLTTHIDFQKVVEMKDSILN
jgi:voltage-gated potassium channel